MSSNLRFETGNYMLRPITRDDISSDWAAWLLDEETARLLNVPVRALSLEELGTYLEQFDNDRRILLGIFLRSSGKHIGLFTILISETGRDALYNVMISNGSHRSVAGLRELRHIRTLVGNYCFFERGLRSVTASVVENNRAMIAYLQLAGWKEVGRTKARAIDAGSRSPDLLIFQLTREDYIRRDGRAWTEQAWRAKKPQSKWVTTWRSNESSKSVYG